jgi:hypothetical protein
MSRDRFDVLERFAPLFEARDPSVHEFLRRRDRKRRNQRITAGAVGIIVFLVGLWVASGGSPFHRARPRPATPAPTTLPRGPIGLVGLAPEGAVPSTPVTGEPVLEFSFGHTDGDPGRFDLHVYQDGRLIWQKLGNSLNGAISTGLVEQRLTSGGVELIWAEVLSTGLFDRDVHLVGTYGLHFGGVVVRHGGRLVHVSWGDIGSKDEAAVATPEQVSALKRLAARLEDLAPWLPASAWADAKMKAFVPSRYSLCFETERNVGFDRVLGSLPRSAGDMLRDLALAYREESSSSPSSPSHTWCSVVTTEQARALAVVLEGAHIPSNGGDVFGLVFESKPRGRYALNVSISFGPILPHLP